MAETFATKRITRIIDNVEFTDKLRKRYYAQLLSKKFERPDLSLQEFERSVSPSQNHLKTIP